MKLNSGLIKNSSSCENCDEEEENFEHDDLHELVDWELQLPSLKDEDVEDDEDVEEECELQLEEKDEKTYCDDDVE